ncbi:hypothetical protein IV503_00715 [Klebsiella huaxiensis]|uniref:hypothetical protein n=1 Tax=Klebsiella huaxiensis TaxID=2153354 RepID=UPI002F340440
MKSFNTQVFLTAESDCAYKFHVKAVDAIEARAKVTNHLKQFGDFDFGEILITSITTCIGAVLFNNDGTKCPVLH